MNSPATSPKGNCISNLVGKVLSYTPHWDEVFGNEKPMTAAEAEKSPENFMRFCSPRQAILGLKKSVKSAAEILKEISQAREHKPVVMSEREEQYFWDVLPYQEFESLQELDQRHPPQRRLPCDITMDANAREACKIAIELVMVKRLLEKNPSEWLEQKLFTKEREHAEGVWRHTIFRKRYHQFILEHHAVIRERTASSTSGRLWADYSYLERDRDQEGKNNRGRFEFDLVSLCYDFGLEGISLKEPRAVPQRLTFSSGLNDLLIRIPKYLLFDWKRSFPDDVLKMVQARRGLLDFNPQQTMPCHRKQWYEKVSRRTVKRKFDELVAQQQAKHDRVNMDILHHDLHAALINPKTRYKKEQHRTRLGYKLASFHNIYFVKQGQSFPN